MLNSISKVIGKALSNVQSVKIELEGYSLLIVCLLLGWWLLVGGSDFSLCLSVGGRIMEIKVEGKPGWGLGLLVIVKTTRSAFTVEAFETLGKGEPGLLTDNKHLDSLNLDGLLLDLLDLP